MNYFVIQVTKLADGTIANTVFNFDTLEAAKRNYYYFLSANVGLENLDYCMGAIVNEVGAVVSREYWYANSEVQGADN